MSTSLIYFLELALLSLPLQFFMSIHVRIYEVLEYAEAFLYTLQLRMLVTCTPHCSEMLCIAGGHLKTLTTCPFIPLELMSMA